MGESEQHIIRLNSDEVIKDMLIELLVFILLGIVAVIGFWVFVKLLKHLALFLITLGLLAAIGYFVYVYVLPMLGL